MILVNKWMIIAVIFATLAVAKIKPEKNSGLNGIRTHDLCDTGAVLYQLNPVQAWIFSKLLSCVCNCDNHSLSHSSVLPQFKYMNFHIFNFNDSCVWECLILFSHSPSPPPPAWSLSFPNGAQTHFLGIWIAHFTVVCLVIWPWLKARLGLTLFWWTSLLFICWSCCSCANYFAKALRFVSKQGQPQPHF